MSIREHRLSTTFVPADFLPPDDLNRALEEDWERGPIALNDTSEGVDYQDWYLSWEFVSGDFTVTPQTTGSPVVGVINAPAVTQCSLAFDQNAHVNIAYTSNGVAYLYWYDTQLGSWTTTNYGSGVFTPTLTLDDKRPTQSANNDILLWYTKQNPDETYQLYTREQRDRFLIEYDMGPFVQYLYKLGMHKGLRVQVAGSETIL